MFSGGFLARESLRPPPLRILLRGSADALTVSRARALEMSSRLSGLQPPREATPELKNPLKTQR